MFYFLSNSTSQVSCWDCVANCIANKHFLFVYLFVCLSCHMSLANKYVHLNNNQFCLLFLFLFLFLINQTKQNQTNQTNKLLISKKLVKLSYCILKLKSWNKISKLFFCLFLWFVFVSLVCLKLTTNRQTNQPLALYFNQMAQQEASSQLTFVCRHHGYCGCCYKYTSDDDDDDDWRKEGNSWSLPLPFLVFSFGLNLNFCCF